jgi:hypothetical protein
MQFFRAVARFELFDKIRNGYNRTVLKVRNLNELMEKQRQN